MLIVILLIIALTIIHTNTNTNNATDIHGNIVTTMEHYTFTCLAEMFSS